MSFVGCLPCAVGQQPSMPLINLGRKWTLAYDDDDELFEQVIFHHWNSNVFVLYTPNSFLLLFLYLYLHD